MSDNNNRAPYAEEEEEEVQEEVEEVPLGPALPDIDQPASIKKYIEDVTPYSKETAERMKKFYRGRNRDPYKYTYSDTGDLVVIGKDDTKEDGISLKTYVPYSASDWTQRDEMRKDVLLMAEKKYEEAMETLQTAIDDYRITGAMQPVLAAQLGVAAADAILSRVRYGTRAFGILPNPETRDVLFDQPYETRKLLRRFKKEKDDDNFDTGDTDDSPEPLKLTKLTVREYPYYTFYGSYVEGVVETGQDLDGALDEAPEVSEASVRQRLRDGRWARIFLEPDESANGFLSPFWPADFTLGDTLYSSALQAYEAERARELGQTALRAKILQTRSPRTIRFLVKKVTAQPKDPKGLWLRILTAEYQQHAILRAKLLASGTDALVFADPVIGPSGIGLSPRESAVLDPTKWKSANAVGVALETLRIQLREGTAREAPKNTAPTERAITVEEQEAARTGAIIQAKKKFQFRKPGAA